MSRLHNNVEIADDYMSDASPAATMFYDFVATTIFIFMSYVFLFPCSNILPIDRRTAAVVGATLCYLTRSFLFSDRKMNLEEAVDFEVLVLLGAIMAINFILVHQEETKKLILSIQEQIRTNPRKGFWLVSFAAFIVSPFLTNDGVCLLFVEPILNAFDSIPDDESLEIEAINQEAAVTTLLPSSDGIPMLRLEKSDARYFLLTLACSANIGSALTYTGNPQNMIVAQNSVDVLPPYAFFAYMVLPSLAGWAVTTFYIQHSWMKSRDDKLNSRLTQVNSKVSEGGLEWKCLFFEEAKKEKEDAVDDIAEEDIRLAVMSPNSRGRHEASKNSVSTKIASYIVASPFPFAMIGVMIAMIILIFCEIMSIAGLVCVTAMIMVMLTVCGNSILGKAIWVNSSLNATPNGSQKRYEATATNDEEKRENVNEFFENLFNSIDYSLLLIFLGTFIVVQNLDSTGIPNQIWAGIVGESPFNTFSSVVGISLFVLISSQFLGNVAVIYLAMPNVSMLPDKQRRYAWAILSFVATVGGNLTITGSAANIIVAEKARRLGQNIEFFGHYKVCFWITLMSCAVGMGLITLTVLLDNQLSGW